MSRSFSSPSQAEIDAIATEWMLRAEVGLTAAERAEFEDWEANTDHKAALNRARQTWTMLEHPRLAGRDEEMVRALGARAMRRRRRRVASAALALAVVVMFALQWNSRRVSETWPPTARLIVPEQRTLLDGSVIELRPGAVIEVNYSSEFRRISLRAGEALFHVAKHPARPFIVSTGDLEVRAVGTAVIVAKTSDEVEVIVSEGTVAVDLPSSATATEKAAPTLVDVGHRVRVDLAAGGVLSPVAEMSGAEIAARLDWRTPRVAFTNTALADAVAIMNKHSNLRLVIDDTALAALPVNGVFRLGNSETLLRLMETGFAVHGDRSGNTIMLRKAR